MEASDMLDLIHFYFETENSFFSEEHMKSSSKIKESLYEDMYGRTYKYKYVEKKTAANSNPTLNDYGYSEDEGFLAHEAQDEPVKPFNPMAEKPTPYEPVTKFNPEAANPYEGLLDSPMG